MKSLKSTNFTLSSQSKNMVVQIKKNLFAHTNKNSAISCTPEKLKIFKITSKCFSFFNNASPETDSRIEQEVLLHVIPIRLIVPCYIVVILKLYPIQPVGDYPGLHNSLLIVLPV